MKLGEPMSDDEMDKLLDEQGRAAGPDRRRATRGTSTASSRSRWTRCACRRPTPTSTKLSGGERRRVALCRLLLAAARHAAARRADEPPRRRVRRLARALPAGVSRAPSSPSPTTATSSTTSPAGSSSSTAARASRGRATTRPGSSRSRSGSRRRRRKQSARQRTLARELEWVRMAPRARQAKSKARLTPTRSCSPRSRRRSKRDGEREITIPPGPRLGDLVVEAKGLRKAYGDNAADRRPRPSTCPRGGIVGVIGPNGAGKTTLFRMIVGQEKPDAGALEIGETVEARYVDQSRDALDGERTRLGGDLRRRQGHRDGRQARGQLARLRRVVQLPGRRPAEEGRRTSRAASATACTSPSC